jgi:hypothetical protein
MPNEDREHPKGPKQQHGKGRPIQRGGGRPIREEPDPVADLQLLAARVASRVRTDRDFANQLSQDPVQALSAYDEANPDIMRELIVQDPWLDGRLTDLGGLGPLADCSVTCVCSDGCCVSCWIGSSARPQDLSAVLGLPTFGAEVEGMLVLPEKEQLLQNLIERGHITREWG